MVLQSCALTCMAASAAGLPWLPSQLYRPLPSMLRVHNMQERIMGLMLINAEALVSIGLAGISSRKFLLLFMVASLVQPIL